VEFFVLPFTRHWDAFQRDTRFDAVTMVPAASPSGTDSAGTAPTPELNFNGFSSGIYIWYENGIVFRAADFPSGLGARPIQALAGKRVVAFAGASAILPGLKENMRRLSLYVERDDQFEHSMMLFRRSV